MGRYVSFNQSRYVQALENELNKAMSKVSQEVILAILSNFGALDMREIDRKYMADMLRTIRYANDKVVGAVVSRFRAGYDSMPNESYRVVYYEYGTGNLMRPPSNYSPSNDPYWNPARPKGKGEAIWTRPASSWKDAGGNWHTSLTKGKPRPLSHKSRRGQPIEPQHWFSRGFWTGSKNLEHYVLNAVKSVPISPYISIANIHRRM